MTRTVASHAEIGIRYLRSINSGCSNAYEGIIPQSNMLTVNLPTPLRYAFDFDISWLFNFNYFMVRVVGMNFVSLARIRYVRDYLTTGIGRLTHWDRVTHICVSELTIIGSDNGMPPGRRQAIIWTNAEILLIGPLGTKFNELLIEIHTFSFTKMYLKMSSGKWRPFCVGLSVLNAMEKWYPHDHVKMSYYISLFTWM